MGAVYDNDWFVMQWEENFIQNFDPSIEFLELFALTAPLVTWSQTSKGLHNRRIVIFCDNQAVISMVNNLASSCIQCRKLIRIIALCGIRYNFRVVVRFVRSKDNNLSDALSRLQFKQFWDLAPRSMSVNLTQIDECLLPMARIWEDESNYLKLLITGNRQKIKFDSIFHSGNSSTTSAISASAMQDIVDKLKTQSYRNSTRKNYYGIWKHFNQFYICLDVKPDTWEERLILFVGHLIHHRRKSTTIKCCVCDQSNSS